MFLDTDPSVPALSKIRHVTVPDTLTLEGQKAIVEAQLLHPQSCRKRHTQLRIALIAINDALRARSPQASAL